MTTSPDRTVAPVTDHSTVLVDVDEGVAVIRLNRPERMNAYNRTMATELKTAIIACDQDNTVGAIVITGTGDHFCVGADLAPGAENRFAELRESASVPPGDALEFFLRAWSLNTPIIGALNGTALGVGLTIALQWDIRIVAEDARLGFIFPRRGVISEANSIWLLPRLIGLSNALDLLLTGRIFDGREAHRIGLAAEAVPKEKVLDTALARARDIVANVSPYAVAETKRLLYEAVCESDRERAWSAEREAFDRLAARPDAQEAVAAFLEKRPAQWITAKGGDPK